MSDRLKSMKRILAVQQQMVQLAEWRLGTVQRQTTALKADQLRLQAFASQDGNLSPLLSDAVFRRGKSLQTAIVKGEAEVAAQSSHRDTMRRKEKLAEKLRDRLKSQAEQEAEKQQLQQTIEASAWKDDASFP